MKRIIHTDKAPAPVGPYHQAVIHNDTLYVSGQIALDAQSGQMIQTSIEAETRQVLANLRHILAEADLSPAHIIKCSVFVTDMEDYGRINAEYAEFFKGLQPPARELVQVARLPKDARVEISAIAAFD
jgi:2-iminobutanoate/2-iminopropanoate deaminase